MSQWRQLHNYKQSVVFTTDRGLLTFSHLWPSSGGYTTSVCNQPTRSTQPCIPPGSLNRVPALISQGKGGNVTSAGWQVTLCDPIWHVSSRSGVGMFANCYTFYLYLYLLHLYYLYSSVCVFSALKLVVGWQEGHLACKKWVVGCWHGYLSGARCRFHMLSWCHCHSLSLAPVNPDWFYLLVLPFSYQLTRVVPDTVQGA